MVILITRRHPNNTKEIIERAETMDYYQKLEYLLSQMALECKIVKKIANKPSRSSLMITTYGGRREFSAVSWNDGIRKRRSINKDEDRIYRLANLAYTKELAARLSYDKALLDKALKQMRPLDYMSMLPSLPKHFDLLDPDRVMHPEKYGKRPACPNPSRLVLPTELSLSIETDLWEWARKPYCENTIHPETKIHRTRQGLLCRSKSEAFIFGIFMDLGIPFHYDEVFTVYGRRVSPDFAGVRRDHALILGEHRGLQSVEYLQKNAWKEQLYAEAGFYPGINLFYTFDGLAGALNVSLAEAMIREIFWL